MCCSGCLMSHSGPNFCWRVFHKGMEGRSSAEEHLLWSPPGRHSLHRVVVVPEEVVVWVVALGVGVLWGVVLAEVAASGVVLGVVAVMLSKLVRE